MATATESSQQPEFSRKAEEAEARLPSAPPPYSTHPQTYNYPTDASVKPADPSMIQWRPQQPGYAELPQSEVGYTSVPIGQGQTGMVFVPQTVEQILIVRERESFVKQIILSCVVFWLCCWPLGLVAFILAMIANGKSREENSAMKAHMLGVHSCRTSIAGIVMGVIIIIVYIILNVT